MPYPTLPFPPTASFLSSIYYFFFYDAELSSKFLWSHWPVFCFYTLDILLVNWELWPHSVGACLFFWKGIHSFIHSFTQFWEPGYSKRQRSCSSGCCQGAVPRPPVQNHSANSPAARCVTGWWPTTPRNWLKGPVSSKVVPLRSCILQPATGSIQDIPEALAQVWNPLEICGSCSSTLCPVLQRTQSLMAAASESNPLPTSTPTSKHSHTNLHLGVFPRELIL